MTDEERAAYVARYLEDWKSSAHWTARMEGREILAREHRAVAECQVRGCRTVLDAGCNDGYFSIAAARKGLVPTLCDLHEEILLFANSNLERHQATASDSIVATLDELPALKRRWDAVVCMEVVEHVPDPEAAVAALRACAERLVVLTTPVGESYSDPLHIHHWADEPEVVRGLGLRAFRRLMIDRIASKDGDDDRVFLIVGEV